MLKTRHTFKSERQIIFTEEVNKTSLSRNNAKWMQAINSIETYEYFTNKDLVSEKEEIECNNITKQCKKWSTLMMFQKKT